MSKVQDLHPLFRDERDSGGRNDVTDILNLLKLELSLRGVDSDIELAQSRKDFATIREEGGPLNPVDEDVIYIELADDVD